MEYKLKFDKPSSLRGSDHGKIAALQDLYNTIINYPSSALNSKTIREEIQITLKKLGCTNLEVKGYPDYIEPDCTIYNGYLIDVK